jgi:rhodanese-related sulfurtransferase
MRTSFTLSIAVFFMLAASLSYAAETSKGFKTYPDIVDFKFMSEQAIVPKLENVTIIDSRPARKFDKGHIPVAINISDSMFNDHVDLLPKDKSSLLVFYCGGLTCPLSHKSAFKAEALGYDNIKVYAAGYPDWTSNGGLSGVTAKYVKKSLDKGKAVVIDARPPRKFKKGHVPGSVSIPTTRFDDYKGSLPEDKATELIFYCGGYHCPLSTKGANKAKELGYSKARVFQAGYPAWKKAYGQQKLSIKEAGEEGVIAINSFMDILKNHPNDVHLVDVRDPGEVDVDGTFATATVIPIDKLLPKIAEMPNDKPTVFFCSNGARAGEAYDFVNMKRSDMKAYFLEANVAFKKQPLPVVTPLEE